MNSLRNLQSRAQFVTKNSFDQVLSHLKTNMDSDGDIDMATSQPVYEFVKAPRLLVWSQPALVQFLRDRGQYEEKIRERCAATGEVPDRVAVSVKSSIEPRVLEHLAHYVFKVDIFDITDVDLRREIDRKAGHMMNDHVPDVDRLVTSQLKMDMRERDIEARVSKYYMDFDRLVEDHGLRAVVGRGPAFDDDGRQRLKTRCKLLIKNLQPEALRVDVERLVSLTHRRERSDDVALYDLIVDRATRQQHYHLIQGELKREPSKRVTKIEEKAAKPKPISSGAAKGAVDDKARSDPPKDGCLHCKGSHWLSDCPTASPAQKEAARRQWKARKDTKAERVRMVRSGTGAVGQRTVTINDVLEVSMCPDTGADCNVISSELVSELCDLDSTVIRVLLQPPVSVELAGGMTMSCTESVTIDVRIQTTAGLLNLRKVRCLVLEGHENEFLLGRETLKEIGIDLDAMIDQLGGTSVIARGDCDDLEDDYVVVSHDQGDGVPAEGSGVDEVDALLENMLQEAMEEGFDPGMEESLRTLVAEYKDVWRVRLGQDEPARVEPMRVQLRDDAEPHRSATRKYPQLQREFLRRYVRELEENGLIVRNNTSRWASAAHPVRKQGTDEYRITVDYRNVNQMTVPLASTTPNLAAVTQSVRGAYGFAKFDFFKGFWQLPLAEDSREYFSFVTEDGVFTPTRVPQGASDSAPHFQLQMHEVFSGQLFDSVLVWIDDVLLFARDAADFVERLRVFFEILRRRNLKLNAKKCKIYAPKVIWCGKVIDGEGIEHDPARLAVLREMPLPPTAAALQHFLCAVNWLRESMVDYARTVGPLQAKLEKVMAKRGRKKKQLSGVILEWNKDDEAAFQVMLKLLATSTKQFFAEPTAEVCLFTDASNVGWAVVLTQVKRWNSAISVAEQDHDLLVCLAGLFKGAEFNWSVTEKEAYPIVRACSNLAYLLEREKGFRIFCDHSNLIQIFSPKKEVKAHIKGKLQRWALKIVGARYSIEHIRGEDNVWADIVSRWGQPTPAECASVKRVTTRSAPVLSELRPLQDENFVWPVAADIARAQEEHRAVAPEGAVEIEGLLRVDGKVWLPAEARELVQRVFIVAHCGLQGHRGEQVMVAAIQAKFEMARLRPAVGRFIRACLLCKHVKGGKLIQREWDPAAVATRRNECMHMDYLFLGESYGSAQYVLVMKDELTHYCELVAADAPTSLVAAEAVLDWHKRFGVPEMWVSDNGSHFKANLLAELAQRAHVAQKFVPVYTPWINGTVERVNKDILHVLRVMLMELNLDTRNWVHLLPVIQANLNHCPMPSLDGHAPMELFTGLPAPSPLTAIVLPGGRRDQVLQVDLRSFAEQIQVLRVHLAEMHTAVVSRKEQRRLYEMSRHRGQVNNFEVGDYVLWSRVDKRLHGGKLMVRWVGPFRVTEALPHSFLVQHLLTGDKYDVHGSRLKFYRDADLNVSAEIREHVSNQGLVLGVRAIVGHRRSRTTGEMELNVAWRGLEDVENSWEPLAVIFGDVPGLVRQYVEAEDDSVLTAVLSSLSDN
jgi:transposase InsO family protein